MRHLSDLCYRLPHGLLCLNISLHQSDASSALIMKHLTRGLCKQVQFSIHPLMFYDVFVVCMTACNVQPLNLSGLRGAPGYSLEQAHHLPIEMDPLIGQCTEISAADFIGFFIFRTYDNTCSHVCLQSSTVEGV